MGFKKIPEAELEIMKVICSNKSSVSSKEMASILQGKRGWEKNTTLTLLSRLVKKLSYDVSDNTINVIYSELLCEIKTRKNICLKFCKNISKRRLENMLNLKTKKKGMLLGVLSLVIIVSSMVSVQVFAKSNSNTQGENVTDTNKVTIVSVNDKGQPTLVKCQSDLSSEQKSSLIDNDGGHSVKVLPKKPNNQLTFNMYTYSNAPADVKSNYEANCKAVNKQPSSSDQIFVAVNK